MNSCKIVALADDHCGVPLFSAPPLLALAVVSPPMRYSPTRSCPTPRRNRARATCRAGCAAWYARTSRSTIPAPLARDLRLLVRERIAAGDSDQQVLDFLVARYGEFVLLKPPFEPSTLPLWLLTPLILIGGGLALWGYNRRRSKAMRRPRIRRRD